ncbi:MAG: CPBP family glutamic-type intramembrane protease, partial [Bacteroidales bacterium]
IAESVISLLGVNFNRRLVILIIPLLFSLVHYPSFVLMIFTFFMEMVFMVVYLKWKNLLAIGLAHGWIATFLLYYVMERDLWSELLSLA